MSKRTLPLSIFECLNGFFPKFAAFCCCCCFQTFAIGFIVRQFAEFDGCVDGRSVRPASHCLSYCGAPRIVSETRCVEGYQQMIFLRPAPFRAEIRREERNWPNRGSLPRFHPRSVDPLLALPLYREEPDRVCGPPTRRDIPNYRRKPRSSGSTVYELSCLNPNIAFV